MILVNAGHNIITLASKTFFFFMGKHKPPVLVLRYVSIVLLRIKEFETKFFKMVFLGLQFFFLYWWTISWLWHKFLLGNWIRLF